LMLAVLLLLPEEPEAVFCSIADADKRSNRIDVSEFSWRPLS